jgi:hypothetical protein
MHEATLLRALCVEKNLLVLAQESAYGRMPRQAVPQVNTAETQDMSSMHVSQSFAARDRPPSASTKPSQRLRHEAVSYDAL